MKINKDVLILLFCNLLLQTTGCMPPSLLITPVSSQRKLVETVLSSDSFFARNKIVLIDVSGVLMNAPKSQFLGKGEHPVSMLLEQLEKARRDHHVKAVILRINSPGGTVVASELMHEEIMYYKEKTGNPVIAVMMDVAASGGYYIACACDMIIAQPSTVTGSIGVIMQMVDLSGTMKMIGIKSEAITSGDYKDAGSPLRALKPAERKLFQDMVLDMYERFVKVVTQGRPRLDQSAVRKLADGRVYTANQALEKGLIDEIAGMRKTIEITKEKAGVESTKLVTYHRSMDYRPNYYAHAPQPSIGNINLLHMDLSSWINSNSPRFMYLWKPGY